MISAIVAVDKNWGIGYQGQLLEHIPEDLKYFKSVTTGHPVIMGRKTYESIGRPLPGRRNVVLTRGAIESPESKNPQTTSFEVVHTLDQVYEIAKGEGEFFIMGGGMLYNQSFDKADKLYITHIYAEAENADTFFPEIDPKMWVVEKEGEMLHDQENDIDFKFVVYTRAK